MMYLINEYIININLKQFYNIINKIFREYEFINDIYI